MTSGRGSIAVLPVGELPHEAPRIVAEHIAALLNLSSDILPAVSIPSGAYDEVRSQYDAGRMIQALETLVPAAYEKVIGLVNVDLFIPIFTHVLGEAQVGGRFAIASLFRLRKARDGTPPSEKKIFNRLVKVAVHEIGHLFNGGHCMDKTCLMNFSGNVRDLDDLPLKFCLYCGKQIQASIP
jgi:archaemetzincin